MSNNDAKPTAKDLDLRVRARHLTSGKLDQKTIERYVAGLPDLADEAEGIDLKQPAITGEADDES